MQYQEKRGILCLISNGLVSGLYAWFILAAYQWQLLQNPDDRVFWAVAILAYIAVLIVSRLIVVILFAIIHKISTNENTVETEDELDKLIDLKSTRIFYGVFMAGLVLALLTQAVGWPVWVLFAGIAAAIAISGLIGDLVQLIYYSRGI